MAEEESPSLVVTNEVSDNDDAGTLGSKGTGINNPEAAMESPRAQAEARRRRIMEKANNRMKFVNGEKVQDEEEKKTSLSNAARIRAARQRRYGKKSTATLGATPSTPSAKPATTSTPKTENPVTGEVSVSTSNVETDPERVESDGQKERVPKAATEVTTSAAEDNPTALATAAGTTTKKRYVGVARMRRNMLVKKKMEENNDLGASNTANSDSAKASLSSDGKSSKRTASASSASIVKAGLSPIKVQTFPIYMHMIVILLLFVAGFDVGVQQFHVDVDVRSQVAVQEYGVPFVQRNPWHPLKPITTRKGSNEDLEEKISSVSSLSGTAFLQDEFNEEIDEEYIPPNIDPIFRVDLDELTKGSGFLNQMARVPINIHRWILWIFYYGPMGLFASILSIPAAFIESPPGLFLAAIILRQIVGKGVLGATIPEDLGDDSTDGKKEKSIEILSMAKNFVKNFFITTFPTVVTLYDVYLHVKADMYVVLCGVFFGLAWTHLSNSVLSCDADVADGYSGDPSEGEL